MVRHQVSGVAVPSCCANGGDTAPSAMAKIAAVPGGRVDSSGGAASGPNRADVAPDLRIQGPEMPSGRTPKRPQISANTDIPSLLFHGSQ